MDASVSRFFVSCTFGLVFVFASACGKVHYEIPRDDAGADDASMNDASNDAGSLMDAGPIDAGAMDAAGIDVPVVDAPSSDAPISDASILDADDGAVIEPPLVAVSPMELVISEWPVSAEFSVVLTRAPTSPVTVTVTSSDLTEATVSTDSLTFTTSDWSTPQTVTVSAVPDSTVDGDATLVVEIGVVTSADLAFDGFDPDDVNVTAIDADDHCISCDSSGVPRGGATTFSGNYTSEDGRYVAFVSAYAGYVPGDTNTRVDVFVHDRALKTKVRTSVGTGGAQMGTDTTNYALSANARFTCFTANVGTVFVHDTLLNTTIVASLSETGGDIHGFTSECAVSDDGRYVAFRSSASDVVSGDTNATDDIFLRDTVSDTTTRITVTSAGGESPAGTEISFATMSRDGRFVAFQSTAPLDASDTNGVIDIYVRDTMLNTTTLVSVSNAGIVGNANSAGLTMTPSGRYVVFQSGASNLVAGDTNGHADLFVRDLMLLTTELVSDAFDGTEANASAGVGATTDDRRFVIFSSAASNLTDDDLNGVVDVFLRTESHVRIVSLATSGEPVADASVDPFTYPAIAANGVTYVYVSAASNLLPLDTNGVLDVIGGWNY